MSPNSRLFIPSGGTGPAGPPGPPGPAGGPGPAGTPGSVWYTGGVNPAPILGVNNDFYLNSSSGDYFEKIAGVWVMQGNLKGPAGSAAPNTVLSYVYTFNSITTPFNYNLLTLIAGSTINKVRVVQTSVTWGAASTLNLGFPGSPFGLGVYNFQPVGSPREIVTPTTTPFGGNLQGTPGNSDPITVVGGAITANWSSINGDGFIELLYSLPVVTAV